MEDPYAFHGSLLLPYYETKEHGANSLSPLQTNRGQPEWEVEEIWDSRRYRHKLQYLIGGKGYSDTHNSGNLRRMWPHQPPRCLHKQNTAAIRKLETEQANCGQSTSSLESKERNARHCYNKAGSPLDSKGQTTNAH